MRAKNPIVLIVTFLIFLSQAACKSEPVTQNNATEDSADEAEEVSEAEEMGDSVSFISFGDWGSGSENQQAVATAIKNFCNEETCEFVLTLGDNFYNSGVTNVTDPQWEEKYRNIYGDLNLPFYAALGNHDAGGNIQAQIDYSELDSSWHMPATCYSFIWPEASNPPLAEFFIFHSTDFDEEEQNCLSRALAGSQATWKLLAMHHPIYSNSDHGNDDVGNNEELLPIICNKVDLVLSGHDHVFSHLSSDEDGCPIEQLIIGNGGKSLYDIDTSDPRVRSTGKFYGFGWFEITAGQVNFRSVTKEGELFYQTSWNNRE